MKLLTLLALVAPATLALPLPLSDSATPSSGDLVGATLEVLRAALGPPVSVNGTKDVLSLDYRDGEGQLVSGAVLVAGGIVMRSAPGLVANSSTELERSVLLAGPLELLEWLGPVQEVTQSASAAILHFEGLSVDLIGGVAVGARRR
jgi:hypothetical protein